MVRLIDASSSHSISMATHKVAAFGIATIAQAASAAPARKYGRRRPKRVHVRSE
jgi:hypothetical protein